MRGVLIALVVLQVLVPLGASAIEGKVLVELNTVEISEDRCRLNFVIEKQIRTGARQHEARSRRVQC
jgi:hypothetical protein